tara:strand:- start:347 stop:748 length:402 start_codon:yes stop_codon:yes gene_type:complete
MKTTTKKQLEQNRKDRLKTMAGGRGPIRRNTWGMMKDLKSSPYAVPDGVYAGSLRPEDVQTAAVRHAVQTIKSLIKRIDSLKKDIKDVPPEMIVKMCKDIDLSGGVEEILNSDNISDELKWMIIYNLDEAIKK